MVLRDRKAASPGAVAAPPPSCRRNSGVGAAMADKHKRMAEKHKNEGRNFLIVFIDGGARARPQFEPRD